jgi:hypothetical protein
VDELSFRCGQMSVRREAANVLPVIVDIRDMQCSWCPSWAVPSYQHEQADRGGGLMDSGGTGWWARRTPRCAACPPPTLTHPRFTPTPPLRSPIPSPRRPPRRSPSGSERATARSRSTGEILPLPVSLPVSPPATSHNVHSNRGLVEEQSKAADRFC